MDKLKPAFNKVRAYISPEDKRRYWNMRLKTDKEYAERKRLSSRKRYARNRDEINRKKRQKYTCGCGSFIRADGKLKHERSKKHQNWLKLQKNPEECDVQID